MSTLRKLRFRKNSGETTANRIILKNGDAKIGLWAALCQAKEKGIEVKLPSREIYRKGPGMIFKGNPQNYLTEIQFMIKG